MGKDVVEHREGGELRDDAEETDEVEAEEACEWAHARGRGSSRKSWEVWR